jgi:hypothetical protein
MREKKSSQTGYRSATRASRDSAPGRKFTKNVGHIAALLRSSVHDKPYDNAIVRRLQPCARRFFENTKKKKINYNALPYTQQHVRRMLFHGEKLIS